MPGDDSWALAIAPVSPLVSVCGKPCSNSSFSFFSCSFLSFSFSLSFRIHSISTPAISSVNAFQSACNSLTFSFRILGSLSHTAKMLDVPSDIPAAFAFASSRFANLTCLYASVSRFFTPMSSSSSFISMSSLSSSIALGFALCTPGNLASNSTFRSTYFFFFPASNTLNHSSASLPSFR